MHWDVNSLIEGKDIKPTLEPADNLKRLLLSLPIHLAAIIKAIKKFLMSNLHTILTWVMANLRWQWKLN